MTVLLALAGRSFLNLFVAALIVYGGGVLDAPDLKHVELIGVAAIIASIAAGLSAVLSYLPRLSFVTLIGQPYGGYLDAFVYAVISTLVITLPGVLGAPDFGTMKSIAVAAITGAIAAGVRAVQGLLTTSEHPAIGTGVRKPPTPVE